MAVRSRLRREGVLVFGALAIPLLLANPPVIGSADDYAARNPLTLGVPTFGLWLELWYAVMLIGLVVFAVRLPSCQAHYLEEQIEAMPRAQGRRMVGFAYNDGVGFWANGLYVIPPAFLFWHVGKRLWVLGKRYDFFSLGDYMSQIYSSRTVGPAGTGRPDAAAPERVS